jgi:hypothetical protein
VNRVSFFSLKDNPNNYGAHIIEERGKVSNSRNTIQPFAGGGLKKERRLAASLTLLGLFNV